MYHLLIYHVIAQYKQLLQQLKLAIKFKEASVMMKLATPTIIAHDDVR